MKGTIVWFRQDLRVEDHPALTAAIESGGFVIPLYIWAPDEEGNWAPGAASRWWLHHSLESLSVDLAKIGLKLIIRSGDSFAVLKDIILQLGASQIFWGRRYEPAAIARDAKIKALLSKEGVKTQSFNTSLLVEPWDISNKQGAPFRVFTSFWRKCLDSIPNDPPLPMPREPKAIAPQIFSEPLANLHLLPSIPWDKGIQAMWRPGTSNALKLLNNFIRKKIFTYDKDRDFPALTGTSLLSPHLHFGEISPRMIRHQMNRLSSSGERGGECYLKQLGWREFSYHLLYHFPKTPESPFRPEFSRISWVSDKAALKAWQHGLTGYPLVDAGMRQLWRTGWMHNRLRMIVGSFLVKDLLMNWVEGAKWFWDTLVDADLANNSLGWQWVAGCGADAAPYFRIFNPILQSKKFDPEGEYIRSWVPELKKLPNQWIHQPWCAPDALLLEAGVELGKNYPYPIVDHDAARKKVLDALRAIKS